MEHMSQEQVEKIRIQATEDVSSALNSLEKDYPGITEGLATLRINSCTSRVLLERVSPSASIAAL